MTVLILTAGERGNPSGRLDESLKTVRTSEAEAAARILGVSRLAVADFRDGAVQLDRDRARAYLADFLTQLRPDLVITFDRAGLDGHPDHVACSEILTELRQAQFHHVRLWYVALPPALLVLLSIVGQMKRTEWLTSRRARPTHRLFLGPQIVTKSRALRAHRSQRRAIGKGLGRAFPTWLMIGLLPFEYFAEAS